MKYFLLIIIISFSYQLKSQNVNFQPYNLDFEIGTPPAMPYIWEITQQSTEYEYAAVSTEEKVKSGKRAIAIFNYTPYKKGMFGTIYQKFDANRYRGKKVYLSANILTEFEGDTVEARLFIHEYDNQGKTINIEQMIDNPIVKSEWDEHKIEMDISNEAHYISIGLVMGGKGAVYMDNVKFEIIRMSNYNYIDNIEYKSDYADNLLTFAKAYSLLRFNLPTTEMIELEPYNYLRYGVENVIKSNNVIEDLKKVFKPVFPQVEFSKDKLYKGRNKYDNELDGYGIVNKTRVAYNEAYPNISQTELKNVFIPDKDKQGYMLKYIPINDLAGKEIVFSSNVKTNLKNMYSNAQLWIRVQRSSGDDINAYMFENPIISNEWKRFENNVKIPEDVRKITIGCVLIGDGEVWFDDIKIEIEENGIRGEIESYSEDFENDNSNNEPSEWKIPNSVKYAGYDFTIDETVSKTGSKSLKISTLNTFIIDYPNVNLYDNYEISKDLFLFMPYGLKVGNMGSLPYSDSLEFDKLKNQVNNNDLNINDLNSRLAVLVELYAYIYNYYLLEDKSKTSILSDKFKLAVEEIIENGIQEYENSLRKFLAVLDDPQIRLWKLGDENLKSLPFNFERYGNEFRVSQIYKQVEGLSVGDKILKIENQDVDKYILNELNYVNGYFNNKLLKKMPSLNGIHDYLINRAISRIVMGNDTKELLFEFDGKKINFKKDVLSSEYIKSNVIDMMKPEDNIMYINMAMFDDKFFKYLAKEINTIDGLIFDARGNSLLSEHFLGYFINEDIKTNMTKVPYFVKPDISNVQYETIQPFLRKLDSGLTKNVVFLIDENTIGYTEFIMNLVDYYDIGTLIGRESAGMPSDIVSIALPLDYSFSFSAFQVSNPGGNSIMFNKVKPKIKVEKQFSIEDKDLIYEEAVEYLKNKLKTKTE